MRLWLAKNNHVPLREQLVSQIILGILSGDLCAGEKLPSTRALARRFSIHVNTVVAAYHDLAARGWIELRAGSGAYVLDKTMAAPTADRISTLKRLTQQYAEQARALGFSPAQLEAALAGWLRQQPFASLLVIDPDAALAAILAAEIAAATQWHCACWSPGQAGLAERGADGFAGTLLVGLSGRAEQAHSHLPETLPTHWLQLNSIPELLLGYTKPAPATLLALVSGWPEFLRWARTILLAVGLDELNLQICLTAEPGWQERLRASDIVITDALTAHSLTETLTTRGLRPPKQLHIFRLIADHSLAALRTRLTEQPSGQ